MDKKNKRAQSIYSRSSANSQGYEDQVDLLDETEAKATGPERQDFKNKYWSRIISLQRWVMGENERYPMAADLAVEEELFDGLDR